MSFLMWWWSFVGSAAMRGARVGICVWFVVAVVLGGGFSCFGSCSIVEGLCRVCCEEGCGCAVVGVGVCVGWGFFALCWGGRGRSSLRLFFWGVGSRIVYVFELLCGDSLCVWSSGQGIVVWCRF